MNLLKRFRGRKQIKDFMRDHRMTFYGLGGLVVHNLVVSEFGYLLRYLTEGKLDTFRDIREIYRNKELILKAIDSELAKDLPRESEVFRYPREIADGNLINLRTIVEVLSDYLELCEQCDVDPYEFEKRNGVATQKVAAILGGATVSASLAALLFNVFEGRFDNNALAFTAGIVGGILGLAQARIARKKRRGR